MAAEGMDAEDDDMEGISEKEQEVFTALLANANMALYNEKTIDALGDALRVAAKGENPGSPVELIALAVSAAVGRVALSGVQSGAPITLEMVEYAIGIMATDIGTELMAAVGAEPLGREQIQAVYLRTNELLLDQVDDLTRADGVLSGMPGASPDAGPGGPPPEGGGGGGGAPPRQGNGFGAGMRGPPQGGM